MTIEDLLRRHAERQPSKTAIVCAGQSVTYAELWDLTCGLAKEFEGRRGEIVPFTAKPEIGTIARYLAMHLAGAAAAPLDKALPAEAMAQYELKLKRIRVPEGTADVLFTTGTTGNHKGVVISHDTIIANSENLIDAQGFTQDVNFIVNGPLNHIGSLSKIHPTLYVGGTITIVDGMRDLAAFFGAIERAEGSHVATFLVPANIRMLLTFARAKLASLAGKIEFIETGAAPLAQSDMESLCAALPHTRIYNTYASTETGIISTFDINAGGCIPGCLGRPMRHSRVTITPDGHVACSGRTLMTGYLGDEERTRQVMRDGTLVTSDMGHIDPEGRLRLTGRADDVINIGGFKVSPAEVEEAAMGIEWVRDCICVGVGHKMMGTTLKLIVVTDGRELDGHAIANALSQKLEPHKVPTAFERAESIKRTFNGKLDRKAYGPGVDNA